MRGGFTAGYNVMCINYHKFRPVEIERALPQLDQRDSPAMAFTMLKRASTTLLHFTLPKEPFGS